MVHSILTPLHISTGQLYCTFEDIHYSRGQTFTSTDGCRQCTCGNNGRVSCQRRQCNGFPDPGSSIGFPIGLPDGRRPIALPDGRTQRVGFPEDRDSIGFPRSGGQIGFSNSGSSISRGNTRAFKKCKTLYWLITKFPWTYQNPNNYRVTAQDTCTFTCIIDNQFFYCLSSTTCSIRGK